MFIGTPDHVTTKSMQEPITFTDSSSFCSTRDELRGQMDREGNRAEVKTTNMETNPRGLPIWGPSMTYESHIGPFEGYQTYLTRLTNQWVNQDCGTIGDLPEYMLEQATRTVPAPPSQQPARTQAPVSLQPQGNPWVNAAKTGAIIVGAGIVAGAAVVVVPEVALPALTVGAALP